MEEENGLIKIESRKGKGKNNLVILLKVERVSRPRWGCEPGSDLGEREAHNKENNIKDSINVDVEEPFAIDVIEYFRRRVRGVGGFDLEIDYGKDGKMAKERLKKYSLEEIKKLIDWYLSSRRFERFGASLSICLSTFMINLWKAERAGQKSLEKPYPTWRQVK